MKIIVCIKQVPETQEVRLDPVTHTLKREGIAAIINPFDLYALEEGLRVKDAHGGTVTLLTMGPPQAEAALREALGFGADAAVLLSDKAFAGADTWATALTLAKAVEKLGGADLIFCGKQAIDGDTAQVGPGVAAQLDLPQAACVRRIVSADAAALVVERVMDAGVERLRVELPCVLTVLRELNEPCLPTLPGVLAAREAEVPVWTAADLALDPASVGLKGSPTRVARIFAPPARPGATMLVEPDQAAIDALAAMLDGSLSRGTR
jgi:electron transfer flavoprotein beta subunit